MARGVIGSTCPTSVDADLVATRRGPVRFGAAILDRARMGPLWDAAVHELAARCVLPQYPLGGATEEVGAKGERGAREVPRKGDAKSRSRGVCVAEEGEALQDLEWWWGRGRLDAGCGRCVDGWRMKRGGRGGGASDCCKRASTSSYTVWKVPCMFECR
jgi:hypothetical protein